MTKYTRIEAGDGKFVKAWMDGVPFDANTIEQLKQTARLSIVHPYVAAMPDAHLGYGSTVGSVIPTRNRICPASVGVDIGCGMVYQQLNLKRTDLPEDLSELRKALEQAIPNGGPGEVGSWGQYIPQRIRTLWMNEFDERYETLCAKYDVNTKFAMRQLGTLGTGNHFVELTEDSINGNVGILIHSGSRGLGNRIGSLFTKLAHEYCVANSIDVPHKDLSYFPINTPLFQDYMSAVHLAQKYAWHNRLQMLSAAYTTIASASSELAYPNENFVHCHHNYVASEIYPTNDHLLITRKGAVYAGTGAKGIIPGSMGAKTFIVEGLGSFDSFMSCSHGAGRTMSRTKAKESFTVEEHAAATAGIECDKTKETLDETPGAYKPIDAVMAAQDDLVRPLYSMKQFLCVKGLSGPGWKERKQQRRGERVLVQLAGTFRVDERMMEGDDTDWKRGSINFATKENASKWMNKHPMNATVSSERQIVENK